MTLDIYDDLEHLVPAERRDAFLRLSRQIKEYGDHNPELLRLVEVMGFLSLYTNDLPKRIAVEIDRGLATSQAANTACADMRAATTQLCTQLTTLQNTVDSAKAVAEHLALADADKIKAASEGNAKTPQAITSAASTISRRLAAIRRWDLLVIVGLALIGGAWFVWNDHVHDSPWCHPRSDVRSACSSGFKSTSICETLRLTRKSAGLLDARRDYTFLGSSAVSLQTSPMRCVSSQRVDKFPGLFES
jgi:hypothetical protein